MERNLLLGTLIWILGVCRSCAETAVMREREHRGEARGRAALGLIGRRSIVDIFLLILRVWKEVVVECV